jgi:mRNA interferase HigB
MSALQGPVVLNQRGMEIPTALVNDAIKCSPNIKSRVAITSCKATWTNLIDVQKIYPTAEAVSNFTVFNIKGNTYRLIVDIVYTEQTIFIKYVLTHGEYDKEKWKNDPYF